MAQFNDDYFRDLPPRDRRYDTPVADQLVFSVFPNGVKAWVHVYPCDDFVRRRTIGLFPETDYEAALDALEQSRRIAEVDALEIRRRSPAKRRGPRYLLVGVAAAVLASVGTYLVTDSGDDGATANPEAGPSSAPRIHASADKETSPAAIPEPVVVGEVGDTTTPGDGPTTTVASQTVGLADGTAPPSAAAEPGGGSNIPAATSAAEEPAGGENQRLDSADPGPGLQTRAAEPDVAGSATLPAADADVGEPAGASPDIEPAVDNKAPESEGENVQPGPASIDDQEAGANPQTADVSGSLPPAATGVRVTRAALSRGIRDREPVEVLSEDLLMAPGETVEVYFFTELHGFAGETVTHRWELDGVIVAEVPFTMGNNSRWRVYSSKSIGPDGEGRWRAVAVNDRGREIGALSFGVRIEKP